MRIRHLVARTNVDEQGWVRDPTRIRHGLIVGGRVSALAGPIDPLTHLNLDFPGHRADVCVVAEELREGARICTAGDGFQTARVRPSAYSRLGPVNVGLRRAAWLAAVRRAAPAPGVRSSVSPTAGGGAFGGVGG